MFGYMSSADIKQKPDKHPESHCCFLTPQKDEHCVALLCWGFPLKPARALGSPSSFVGTTAVINGEGWRTWQEEG